MCAPASLNELIRWFFLYLLQLLRSGSVCCWRGAACLRVTIDAVFWSSFAKSSLQLTPPRTQFLFRRFEHHGIHGVSVSQEPENDSGVSLQQSVHVNTCATEKLRNKPELRLTRQHLPQHRLRTRRSFHVPLYISYFLLEHRGMFLSTVVTHFINN